MAGSSKSDRLKFISFEKELKRATASGSKIDTDSMSMSNFVKDIDTIGRESSTTALKTTTTNTTTVTNGKGTTPNPNQPHTSTDPTIKARHGHDICPNPLPWSPHRYFQGPMCGCHYSNWCHGGTAAYDQSEPKTS